jgi:hypothetical protein
MGEARGGMVGETRTAHYSRAGIRGPFVRFCHLVNKFEDLVNAQITASQWPFCVVHDIEPYIAERTTTEPATTPAGRSVVVVRG